jgi:myo-inositol-1(or 4)-monophosphatase
VSAAVTPDDLVELFDKVARSIHDAVAGLTAEALRERTGRVGQYALDLVADLAAGKVLSEAPVRVVSEESGVHEKARAEVTVVLDPVDGSTNCSRGISYWATSICALDAEGVIAALVVNQATGVRYVATRGGGAYRDELRLHPPAAQRPEDSLVALAGLPERLPPFAQFRAMGCASLALCDVATGGIDAYVDSGPWHAPWDYLGGYFVCVEAGAVVRDAYGEELVTDDVEARRQLIAAGTAALADALMP